MINDKTKDLIEKTCKGKENIKLTIGIYEDELTYIHVFDQTGEIPNENYIYEIGSITKTLTASLLAKFITEEKMSLSDPIEKYIAGLECEKHYPTLKQLVTHTSGYHRFLPNEKCFRFKMVKGLISGKIKMGENLLNMDFSKMVHLIKENQLENKDYPWCYSNFGIALVGYAIGSTSGLGYSETMNQFLSYDLNLKNSYTDTNRDKNLPGFCLSNENLGNWSWANNLMSPAGNISSTAQDLLEYARMNILDERPYFTLCHQKYVTAKKHDMGLGWILVKDKNHVIWHNGATGGFRSFLAIDKQKKCAVVVLANYPVNTDKIGRSILADLQL